MAVLIFGVSVLVGPAGAGLAAPTYTFDPTSGPPGTTVTVTGEPDECLPPLEVVFYLGGPSPTEIGRTTPNADGSFSGQFDIPTDAVIGEPVQVGAQCGAMATQYILFDVTAPPTTTTTSTTAPVVAPQTVPTTAAAAPVVTAAPTFTG